MATSTYVVSSEKAELINWLSDVDAVRACDV